MASDDLERLLEKALADYGSAEPRVGMEASILRRVHSRRQGMWWSLAASAIACGFVAAMLIRNQPVPVPVIKNQPIQQLPSTVRPSKIQPIARTVRHKARPRLELPKQAEFPTRSPISQEERLLLTLMHRFPEQAPVLLAEPKPQETEPIRIAELEIKPLEMRSEE